MKHFSLFLVLFVIMMVFASVLVRFSMPVKATSKAESVYPKKTYLARLLEFGRPFIVFSDYEDAFTEQRCWVYSTRVYWGSMNAVERTEYLERHGLPLGTKWDMYEETLLKNSVVYSINF